MKWKRKCSTLLILAMIMGCLSGVPEITSQAAAKIALPSTKLSLVIGGTTTYTLMQGKK